MHKLWLIVGLGNPGRQYRMTRHNLGFMVVNHFAQEYNFQWKKGRGKAEISKGKIDNESIILAKPQSYMNLSGPVVATLRNYYKVENESLLVVCDDVNLPFGRIRLRGRGSDGGHNGLASIITFLGTQDFPRLRIGVGSNLEGKQLSEYVLGKFSKDEAAALTAVTEVSVEAIVSFIFNGLEMAMTNYNKIEI